MFIGLALSLGTLSCIRSHEHRLTHISVCPVGKLALTAAALTGSLLPRGEKDRSTTDESPVVKAQVGSRQRVIYSSIDVDNSPCNHACTVIGSIAACSV